MDEWMNGRMDRRTDGRIDRMVGIDRHMGGDTLPWTGQECPRQPQRTCMALSELEVRPTAPEDSAGHHVAVAYRRDRCSSEPQHQAKA